MAISYQIIAFNDAIGQAQVQFKNNDIPFVVYSVDIPLDENNLFITGDTLDLFLLGMFPAAVLERQQALKNSIANASDIHALMVPLPTPTPTI